MLCSHSVVSRKSRTLPSIAAQTRCDDRVIEREGQGERERERKNVEKKVACLFKSPFREFERVRLTARMGQARVRALTTDPCV